MKVPTQRLREIAEVVTGLSDEKLEEGSWQYLCFQPNSFTDTGQVQSLTPITRQDQVADKQLLRVGDIILKRLNPNYDFLVDEIKEPTIISQNLFAIRTMSNLMLPEYLAYLFEQPAILSQATQLSGSASTIKAISIKMLQDIEIPMILVKRQKMIGELWRLSKWRQHLLQEYQTEASRLMTAMYENFIK